MISKIQNLKQKIKNILLILPVKNIIIMESNPGFTDNTKLVFNKLIENDVNKKYKIVWFVNKAKQFKHIKIKNVKFISINTKYNIFIKIRKIYYNFVAKMIIDCNNFVPKVRKEQYRIYLAHGNPFKKAVGYCEKIGDVDNILEIGKFFEEENMKLFNKPKDCFIDLGFPRNDDLFADIKMSDIFPEYNNKKIIMWLPTFRKHKDNEKSTSSLLKYGLPAVNSQEDFEKIDKVLKEKNIIILLKLHPAQDKTALESFECDNIKVITDEELIEKNLNLYRLLGISDALITDYSSVYYDYLLTKKPIALAINDIEEYQKSVSFVYNYYETIKGDYVYNADGLVEFIIKLADGKDDYLEDRTNCLKKYYTYYDGQSSERVYEFIKKYL